MTQRTAPESTASIFQALWSEYIACLRAGHRSKAAELRAKLDSFDRDHLGL